MYDIYGIVKVEFYSCNKGEYFVHISHINSSPAKEPGDKCFVL